MNVETENIKIFYVLSVFSMAYLVIMLFDSIMTNRYVGTDALYVLGGTLSSPLLFILDGLITELFRRKMAVFIIIAVFLFQTVFSFFSCLISAKAPFPSFFHSYAAYYEILGPSLLWINFSGLIAYLAANILNSYLIMEFKILAKGKFFWIRSIGASFIAEITYTAIAVTLMEMNRLSAGGVFKIILASFCIKVLYTIILSYPADRLINKLKVFTGLDPYDKPKLLWLSNRMKNL